MGQCWPRPRTQPLPRPGSRPLTSRPRSRPLFRPVKVSPIAEVLCEIKNEPRSSSDTGQRRTQHVTPSTLRKLPPLRNPPRVYPYQETKKKVAKKVRWNEKELSKAEEIVEVKHNAQGGQANGQAIKALVQDITGNIEMVEVKASEVEHDDAEWLQLIDDQNKYGANFQDVLKKEEAHLKEVASQRKSERSRKMMTSGNGNLQNEQNGIPAKPARKRRTAAEHAHLAVSSQIFGSSEVADDGKVKEKEQEKPFQEPFWKLGDVPVKPVSLPSIEDIQNEMKSIESEMQALLKPEEKYLKRSVAFTINKVDAARSQTPGCVPQRLLKHQKAQVYHAWLFSATCTLKKLNNMRIKFQDYTKVDRVKILEKQREAERRRNVSIAKRVQSARRRSDVKVVPAKLEEERQQHEKEIQMKVDSKMKAATHRRNDILTQKVHAVKKEARTELVNDREKEIADDHKSKQEVKMSKINENKERMTRRKLRSLKFQDKKRQLARKMLAREKQEEEERCQTIIETETYDGDEDLGEHDWD